MTHAVPGPTPPRERPVRAGTLGAMVLAATERHDGAAIRFQRDGRRVEWSFAELGRAIRDLAHGLLTLGIGPGDRVALLATTRPEWTVVDCAVLAAGATVVPVYQTNSPEECGYVLAHSGARAAIVEDGGQFAKIETVRERCPDLEHVISIEDVPSLPSIATLRRGSGADAALDERLGELGADDAATIVYTSGTTGPPKGCVLTHANCLATVEMYERQLQLPESAVIFMFLPLAHVLARIAQMVALDAGATLAFWSGEPARLLDDIAAARSTHLPSVPHVFEKIHTRALAGVEDRGALTRGMFRWALATGRRARAAERHGGAGRALRAQHALADRLVLSKLRGLFGGDLQLALAGAAPIATDVLKFFDASGVLILEGYGLTETCAAATLNTVDAFRFGTVGRPLPGASVTIAPDGEVLLAGPNVFKGYFRDEEATHGELVDGWLHSGDLGSLDEDGFLRITGRKKDLIITSSGKNIAPANLESALRESRWVSQAVVYGDNRPYLVALLTLDPEEAPALARELGVTADIAAMAADDRVRAAVQGEVDRVGERFARIEQVKRFALLDRDLTQAAGELTPTLKVKRAAIYERYRDCFDALYA